MALAWDLLIDYIDSDMHIHFLASCSCLVHVRARASTVGSLRIFRAMALSKSDGECPSTRFLVALPQELFFLESHQPFFCGSQAGRFLYLFPQGFRTTLRTVCHQLFFCKDKLLLGVRIWLQEGLLLPRHFFKTSKLPVKFLYYPMNFSFYQANLWKNNLLGSCMTSETLLTVCYYISATFTTASFY